MRTCRRRATLLAVLLAILAACGDDTVTTGDTDSGIARTPNLREFSAMLTAAVGHVDVGPPPADPMTPSLAAEHVDLVVTGRIEDVHEGRRIDMGCTMPVEERSTAPGCTSPTVIMTVAVDQTHKGTLPEGSEGRVYVEFRSGPWTAAAYDAVAPSDQQIALYLVPAGPRLWQGRPLPVFIDSAAGRPEGQPVWATGYFLVADSDQRVVQVWGHVEYTGVTIADFLPPSERPLPDSRYDYDTSGEVLEPRTPPDRPEYLSHDTEPEPEPGD